MTDGRTCTTCGIWKGREHFPKCSRVKSGMRPKCKPCVADYARGYRSENAGHINETARHRYRKDPNKFIRRVTEYERSRRSRDSEFRLTKNLRVRFRNALVEDRKRSSVWALVGCSREELMAHLESQFTEGMTWENYGQWHVDHIRPVNTFDDPQDPACWIWSNLRPLWAHDNCSRPHDGSDIS